MLLLLAFASAFVGLLLFAQASSQRTVKAVRAAEAEIALHERLVRESQLHFKVQVQEWKNILLRGHAGKDFTKYQRQFFHEEEVTRESVEELIRSGVDPEVEQLATAFLHEHAELGRQYRGAMPYMAYGEVGMHVMADRRVRGIDREPTYALDAVSEAVQAQGTRDMAVVQAAAKAASRRTIVIAAFTAVFFLAAFTLLFDLWVTRRVSNASKLAKAVSTGDLDAEVDGANDTAKDDIGSLVRSLQRMKEGLRDKARIEAEAREERERHEQAMRDIADNVQAGFFIIGDDLAIRPGFTRSCADLFGRDVAEGSDLRDLLGLSKENERLEFAMAIEGFFDGFMPAELLMAQMPSRFPQADGRVLFLEARPVEHGEEVVGVLMTLTDITALEAAEAQTREAHMLISLMAQRDAFRGFLTEVHEDLLATREMVKRGDQESVRRSVHTIKGNAGCYGLLHIVEGIHQVEEAEYLGLPEIDEVERMFVEFTQRHGEMLRLSYGAEADQAGVELAAKDISELEALATTLPPAASRTLSEWLQYKKTRSAREMMGPIESVVERLAARFDKPVKCKVEGEDVRVDPSKSRTLFRILPHLLRNSLDHGIEGPGQRGEKPETATVTIAFSAAGGSLCLSVQDDGRGIDPEAVANRAMALGMVRPQDAAKMTDQEKIELIFVDELSTKEEANDVSGRGVGMAAVKSTAESLGGSVRLESELGRGTRISLEIPVESTTQRAPKLSLAA